MVRVLALDVDGVLLDGDRRGEGHWSIELARRFEIERSRLRAHFFAPPWHDIVTGRKPIEPALHEALERIGSDVSVEQVLDCWFEADFVPIEPAFEFARSIAATGVEVVLATNQEHRRATYLRARIGARLELGDVLSSAALGVEKSDPAFFDLASARLGVSDRSDVVFVDDTLGNVEVARSCGWHAIHAVDDHSWIRAVRAVRRSAGWPGF